MAFSTSNLHGFNIKRISSLGLLNQPPPNWPIPLSTIILIKQRPWRWLGIHFTPIHPPRLTNPTTTARTRQQPNTALFNPISFHFPRKTHFKTPAPAAKDTIFMASGSVWGTWSSVCGTSFSLFDDRTGSWWCTMDVAGKIISVSCLAYASWRNAYSESEAKLPFPHVCFIQWPNSIIRTGQEIKFFYLFIILFYKFELKIVTCNKGRPISDHHQWLLAVTCRRVPAQSSIFLTTNYCSMIHWY